MLQAKLSLKVNECQEELKMTLLMLLSVISSVIIRDMYDGYFRPKIIQQMRPSSVNCRRRLSWMKLHVDDAIASSARAEVEKENPLSCHGTGR